MRTNVWQVVTNLLIFHLVKRMEDVKQEILSYKLIAVKKKVRYPTIMQKITVLV